MVIIPCLTTHVSTQSRHCYAISEHDVHKRDNGTENGWKVHYLLLDGDSDASPEELLLGLAYQIIDVAERELNR